MALQAKLNSATNTTSASSTTNNGSSSSNSNSNTSLASKFMNGKLKKFTASIGGKSNNNNNNNNSKSKSSSPASSCCQGSKKSSSSQSTQRKVPSNAKKKASALSTQQEMKEEEEEATKETTICSTCTKTTSTTTYRSRSTSALVAAATAAACIRPQTLNVHNPYHETPTDHTRTFFGEVLNAWRAKARCNVVPAERTQELFHELNFNPSEKQISEMLQTAKVLARKGSCQSNGLTFGEFCVLAADLKRFRSSSVSSNTPPTTFGKGVDPLRCLQLESWENATGSHHGNELRSTKSLSHVEDCSKRKKKTSIDSSPPVEVFLGGSCNPTTWRADVAIPALKELGITFYNPQVSDWTPDLIELEHRAKEKARVLFFVMDSETRASAGAIEAAHIAGQNCKQLVLVLHPYKPNQRILNEHISQQEYIDLMRNQLILKELVTRRGLPVLDNIPSGLQRTKEILAGIRDPPPNIASVLVVVRGAFDRVVPKNDLIPLEKCQRALSYLGYADSLINLDNLQKIVKNQRTTLEVLQQEQQQQQQNQQNAQFDTSTNKSANTDEINFDLFCVICAYLSVLQQEIQESGCLSPIKGTNVPPPPVYLTNMQGDDSFAINYYAITRNISRTSSNASVPSKCASGSSIDERQSLSDLLSRSRDSGTSSPQPLDTPLKSRSAAQIVRQKSTQILLNVESIETTEITTTIQTTSPQADGIVAAASTETNTTEEESDSNDSVFSSSSSINSVNCNLTPEVALTYPAPEFRDVYLGGSCFLRTKWRQDVAMPYFKSHNVTFHLPLLHESLQSATTQLQQLSDKAIEEATRTLGTPQERSFTRTRRKCRNAQVEEEEEVTVAEESFTWSLPPQRTNLYNPVLLDNSRVLLFVITNETRSLAPMTLAAHCIGLMYNVVLCVQMLPDECVLGNEKLTAAAIKDYNRGRSYLIDLAKRQGVPVFNDLKAALECTVEKVKACNSRHSN